jgi:hypothetical protein
MVGNERDRKVGYRKKKTGRVGLMKAWEGK